MTAPIRSCLHLGALQWRHSTMAPCSAACLSISHADESWVTGQCRASLEKSDHRSRDARCDNPLGHLHPFHVRQGGEPGFPGSKQSDLVDLAGAPDGDGPEEDKEKGHEPPRTIHVQARACLAHSAEMIRTRITTWKHRQGMPACTWKAGVRKAAAIRTLWTMT